MTKSDIFINIACSFTSSFVFIHLLLLVYKPRIKLSPYICSQEDTFDRIGDRCYLFKMLNISRFKAFEVNVQLYEVISLPAEDGKSLDRYKSLPLKTNYFAYLNRRKSAWFHPKYSDNELLFRSYEDLSAILKDDFKKIVIEVTLKHGLTGITNVIIKEYVSSGYIKEGRFKIGKKLDVI